MSNTQLIETLAPNTVDLQFYKVIILLIYKVN